MATKREVDKLEGYKIKVATLERLLAVTRTSLKAAEKRITRLERKIINVQDSASRSSYGPKRVR